MTQEDKIHAMQVALNIVGIHMKYKHIDAIVALYELIVATDSAATINDVMLKYKEVEERNKEKMPWET